MLTMQVIRGNGIAEALGGCGPASALDLPAGKLPVRGKGRHKMNSRRDCR